MSMAQKSGFYNHRMCAAPPTLLTTALRERPRAPSSRVVAATIVVYSHQLALFLKIKRSSACAERDPPWAEERNTNNIRKRARPSPGDSGPQSAQQREVSSVAGWAGRRGARRRHEGHAREVRVASQDKKDIVGEGEDAMAYRHDRKGMPAPFATLWAGNPPKTVAWAIVGGSWLPILGLI